MIKPAHTLTGSAPAKKQRDPAIDALKGFLIICVLFGHWGHAFDSITNFRVYYFHMPLFIACSLFFVPPISSSFIWKRFQFILIPYALWTIYPGWVSIATKPMSLFLPITFRPGALLVGNWNYVGTFWFLPTIFTANIFFAAYLKTKEIITAKVFNYITIALVVCSLIVFVFSPQIAIWHVAGFIPFGIDISLYFFTYFLFLWQIYYHRKKFENIHGFLFVLLAYAFSYLIYKFEPLKMHTRYPHEIDLAQFSVPSTLIGYISMYGLSASILICFLKLPAKILPPLGFIGKHSFPIYLLHLLFLYRVKNWVELHMPLDNMWLSFFLVYLPAIMFVIGICILISKVLMRISKLFAYAGMV